MDYKEIDTKADYILQMSKEQVKLLIEELDYHEQLKELKLYLIDAINCSKFMDSLDITKLDKTQLKYRIRIMNLSLLAENVMKKILHIVNKTDISNLTDLDDLLSDKIDNYIPIQYILEKAIGNISICIFLLRYIFHLDDYLEEEQ